MGAIESRNLNDDPHEVRPYRAHGHMDVVTLGDFTLGKGTFEPGWRWSEDVKPIAGTDSCQVRHTGFCLSGRMTVRMDDGSEASMGPGDVVVIEPGHDPGSRATRTACSSTPASRRTPSRPSEGAEAGRAFPTRR